MSEKLADEEREALKERLREAQLLPAERDLRDGKIALKRGWMKVVSKG